ncbi:hypothetical protein SAMN04488498_13527 [Mesorhizobium albiziae]|uniref:Uncharacterized protein n=2 Tax=Neomesorhizobium albiziae TaxID=335020 RepID=A0A1I4F5M4_9HYPH|nr:hypothetical protein SAMN04488498_13527 [Mesorhizobium albiziae]
MPTIERSSKIGRAETAKRPMTQATSPSPMIAIIELRALIGAGADVPTGTATRLTDVLRDSFRPWSDPAESVNELTILLLHDKLKPIERDCALAILNSLDMALRRPRT